MWEEKKKLKHSWLVHTHWGRQCFSIYLFTTQLADESSQVGTPRLFFSHVLWIFKRVCVPPLHWGLCALDNEVPLGWDFPTYARCIPASLVIIHACIASSFRGFFFSLVFLIFPQPLRGTEDVNILQPGIIVCWKFTAVMTTSWELVSYIIAIRCTIIECRVWFNASKIDCYRGDWF